MEVYLPIAEVQINVVLVLFVSFLVGLMSGLFGVGGGFLMTPFLIFLGALRLSFGGVIVKSFEGATLWQILFWRQFFFIL